MIVDLEHDLRSRYERADNLGLLSSWRHYQDLASNFGRVRCRSAFVEWFQRLEELPHLAGLAEKRMCVLEDLVKVRAMFAQLETDLAHSTTKLGAMSRDRIVGSSQRFPILARVHSPTYRRFVEELVAIALLPVVDPIGGQHRISKLYEQFLKLDRKVAEPSRGSADHELVRCLFFLVVPSAENDQRAYEHALAMTGAYEERALEFFYVLVWSARRLGRYAAADRFAALALDKAPHDPRFHHGRAINGFAWLTDTDKAVDGTRPPSLRTTAGQTETALALFLQDLGAAASESALLAQACHNDLAYFYSYDARDTAFDLAKARKHVTDLKVLLKRELWTPMHPEYFHTEAHLEYQEFLRDQADGVDRKELAAKLRNASRALESALELNPSRALYKELEAMISGARMQLDKKGLAR